MGTPESSFPEPRRWTSDEVLATGVAEGWADPADPREVDFTKRPSVLGTIEFDDQGRPINPRRTPGMLGDRGELGKWGVNYAADPVVVALGSDGKSRILLVNRSDTEEWALPGGMVDPGEEVSATAKRELREEGGIDLSTVPSKVIYRGYVDDPRNTVNAWMETSASLLLIHYTPTPHADGDETLDAGWFELDGLEKNPGKLYASHDSIVQCAKDELAQFNGTMQRASELHSRGEFRAAQLLWDIAQTLLPDPLERGRAIRGYAASSARLGELTVATQKARAALDLHDQAVNAMPPEARPQALRYRAESRAVLGRIMLGQIVESEKGDHLTASQASGAAEYSLSLLAEGLADILEAERTTGTDDQHKINLLSRLVVAHSLYGDKAQAKQHAALAMKLAWRSESSSNPTSANISLSYALRAKARAVPRAYAGALAARLATPQKSRRRSIALALASNKYFGF